MKSVNLICETELIQERHFYANEQEKVVLKMQQKGEFEPKNPRFAVYTSDLKAVAHKVKQQGDGSNTIEFLCGGAEDCCYIIAEQASINSESAVFVSKCAISVPEGTDELLVVVKIETDEDIANLLLSSYIKA